MEKKKLPRRKTYAQARKENAERIHEAHLYVSNQGGGAKERARRLKQAGLTAQVVNVPEPPEDLKAQLQDAGYDSGG